MSNRNYHGWRTTTGDGEKREVRAHKHGGAWRFQSKLKNEEEWTYHDVPLLEDLHELREILWRKYQRKHLSWEDVQDIDRLIRERGGNPA